MLAFNMSIFTDFRSSEMDSSSDSRESSRSARSFTESESENDGMYFEISQIHNTSSLSDDSDQASLSTENDNGVGNSNDGSRSANGTQTSRAPTANEAEYEPAPFPPTASPEVGDSIPGTGPDENTPHLRRSPLSSLFTLRDLRESVPTIPSVLLPADPGPQFNTESLKIDNGLVDTITNLTKYSEYHQIKSKLLREQRDTLQQTHERLVAKLQDTKSQLQAVDQKLESNQGKVLKTRDEASKLNRHMKRKVEFTSGWLDNDEEKRRRLF